jgi:hypothetical protein
MSNVMQLLFVTSADRAANLPERLVCTICQLISRARLPVPIIKGFSIRDAYILTSYSKMIVSCDVAFMEPEALFLAQTQDLLDKVGSAKSWQPSWN